MKKIVLLALTLPLIQLVSGCSCNKDIYEFYSVSIEDKVYTCSKSDKKDASVKEMCENFDGMSIELEDKDTMLVNIPAYNMENEKAEYKIENGYIYIKDSGEWMKFAKHEKDQIELTMTGVKVVLKK